MDANLYAADGSTILIKSQNAFRITTGTTFKGTGGLTELSQTNNSTFTSAAANGVTAGTTVGPTVVKSYFNFGPVDSIIYGIIATPPVTAGISTVVTSTFTPASIWPTNPALNTPYTQTFVINTEMSVPGVSLPPTTATTTETRTYSTEQITTLAGTFAACKVKYDLTTAGVTTTTFSWQVGSGRLKGHLLKSTNDAGVRTLESTVLLVNGS
jgi:hypothetical protein